MPAAERAGAVQQLGPVTTQSYRALSPAAAPRHSPSCWLEAALCAMLEQRKQGGLIAGTRFDAKRGGFAVSVSIPHCCCGCFPRHALEQLLFLSLQLPPDLLYQPADT